MGVIGSTQLPGQLAAGAADGDPHQQSYAEGNGDRRERMSFGLLADPVQSPAPGLGARPERFVGEVRGLIDRPALPGAEAVFDILQDRPERVDDLVYGGRRGTGGTLTGTVADRAQFLSLIHI